MDREKLLYWPDLIRSCVSRTSKNEGETRCVDGKKTALVTPVELPSQTRYDGKAVKESHLF